MSDPVSAVLFDMDGTLIDSNYLHSVTWWEAFIQAGHDVPMARIHRAIGMGSDQLLDALLPSGRDGGNDAALVAAHETLYATYWPRLRPFRGAADLLRACQRHGLRVVLASSAGPREFEAMRAALGAGDAVHEATSSADVDASKPAPDLVRVALEKAGVRPGEALFVGDTVWDVRACQRAGVACIGLLTGGISEAELRDAGAVQIFADPASLLAGFPGSVLGELPGHPDYPGTWLKRRAAARPSAVSQSKAFGLTAGRSSCPGTPRPASPWPPPGAGPGSARRWTRCSAGAVSSGKIAAVRATTWASGVRMTSARRAAAAATIWRAARSASIDTRGRLAPSPNQVNSCSRRPANSARRCEPVRIRPGTTVVTVTGPRPSSARSP